MNRRWTCPNCGSGVIAPSRPRKDDVRRYCLDCSAETGKLVQRICPANDRARAATSEKRAARTVRTRQAEKASNMAGPYDLMAEARRFMKLPALAGLRDLPDITIRRHRRGMKSHTSGHCHYSTGEIVITIGTDPHDAPGTLLHEMVHSLLRWEGHSTNFWRTLHRAAREAWPTATFNFKDSPNGWRCQVAIADGLRELQPAASNVIESSS